MYAGKKKTSVFRLKKPCRALQLQASSPKLTTQTEQRIRSVISAISPATNPSFPRVWVDHVRDCSHLNKSHMISSFHKTVSDALSSFTSSAKEPKLLKRPLFVKSSEPDDSAAFGSTALTPRSQSVTSSKTHRQRKKESIATQFVQKYFNATGDEDDPIVVCFSKIKILETGGYFD